MRSKGNNPTAKELAWRKQVADFYESHGDKLWGDADYSYSFQLHHMYGATTKANKQKIGEFALLPVPFHMHDPSSNHPIHIHKNKRKFKELFISQQKVFGLMLMLMQENGYTIPFDNYTKSLILEYRK